MCVLQAVENCDPGEMSGDALSGILITTIIITSLEEDEDDLNVRNMITTQIII